MKKFLGFKIIFDEKFEYLVQELPNPTPQDMEECDYDSEEYKTMEWWRKYYRLMLTELGSRGWDLIIKSERFPIKSGGGILSHNEELIFKRSSASRYYKTGFGADIILLRDLAKQQAEEEHIK